jgi:hypothetical protein
MKKFETRFAEVMQESLLEGSADYGDVLDAVGKLKKALEVFEHSYPAKQTTEAHGQFKEQVDQITGRVNAWIASHKKVIPGVAAPSVSPVVPTVP